MAELIGFWNFEEATGATTKDRTGHGNTGNLEGSMTGADWVQGANIIDYALDFDGTDDRVDCGNSAPLNDIGNGSYSFSFWMKTPDSVPLNGGCIIAKHQGFNDSILIQSWGTVNRLQVILAKSGTLVAIQFNSSPFNTRWNHVVVIVDRTLDLIIVFLNGKKDLTEGDISTLPADCSNTANFSIGAKDDGINPYEGIIDEVRVYKGILTPNEVSNLFLNPPGRRITNKSIIRNGLIGLWRFDKGIELIAYDRSGYDNHGDLTNMNNADWVDGISGDALEFDGSNDHVDVGNSAPLDGLGSGDFAYSFWMKSKDNIPLNSSRMLTKYQSADHSIIVRPNGVGTDIQLRIEKSTIVVTCSFVSSDAYDGYWHHIVINVDRSLDIATCYLDTIKDSVEASLSALPADCSNTGNLAFGGQLTGTYYEGMLDEIRLYDRILSTREINFLFHTPDGIPVDTLDSELEIGLMGFWKFDTGSGLIAYDETDFENDGSLEGTMTGADWINGMSGTGLDFDGIDDRVDCGNGTPLNSLGEGDFSISFWMKSLDTVPLSSGRLLNKSDGTGSLWISSNGTINHLRVGFIKGADSAIATFTDVNPFNANWHHIVVVVNRTTDKITAYWNGIKSGLSASTSTLADDASNGGNLSFGAKDDGTFPYEGKIDEMRIYNRVLSSREVKFLFNNPNGISSFPQFQSPDGIQLQIQSPTDEVLGIISDNDDSGNILNAEINVLKIGGVNKFSFSLKRDITIPISLNTECYFYINARLSLIGFVKEEPIPDQDKPILKIEGGGFFERLERRVINESYTSETLNFIACDIGKTYLASGNELDIYFNPYKISVPIGSSITMEFKDKNLLEVYERILEICNEDYNTTKYRMYVDNEKELVIESLDTSPITTLFEGFEYQTPDVTIDNSKVINEVLSFRTKSAIPKEVEFNVLSEKVDKKSRFGERSRKLLISDFCDTTTIARIVDSIFERNQDPQAIVKIENYEFSSILEFGDYILSNRRELYWRIIADCDTLDGWDVGNLATATATLSTDHVITGRQSLKITAVPGSINEYIEFTPDNLIALPQIVRSFIYFATVTPELEIKYYDDKGNDIAISIGDTDLFNDQWVRWTENIGLNIVLNNMDVDAIVATPTEFEIDHEGVSSPLELNEESVPGLLLIAKIRITIKSAIDAIFYIDRLDVYADLYNFHTLQLEEIDYKLSSVGLFADINFGEKQDDIINELKEEVKDLRKTFKVVTKQ